MATTNQWGHCEHCKFFASPAAIPLGGEEAHCRHPVLAKYELCVFGASGCNGFELRPGLPESVEQVSIQQAGNSSRNRKQPAAR